MYEDMEKILDNVFSDSILEDTRLRICWEIYKTDDDGARISSLGVLASEALAKAYVHIQKDAHWFKVRKVLALVNEEFVFLLRGMESVVFLDSLAIREEIKKDIFDKFPPEIKTIFGSE